MGHYEIFHEYGDELERRIRPRTFPLAVKLLESEAGIPKGTQRPLTDLGYPIALCQDYALSRRRESPSLCLRRICGALSR